MIPIARPQVGPEEEEAVLAVLRSGMLASGSVTREFGQRFAAMIGTKEAVAVNSGTAALHLALVACDVGPGDDVLVPAFSFIASANAVLMVGARPVFVDIDPQTYTMDVEDMLRARTDATKAMMPVHLYGLAASMRPMLDAADDCGWSIIEDCAQSHGATYDGRQTGSLGRAGCFSFYPTKNMTTGEGGMITTDDVQVAAVLRSLRNHGRPDPPADQYDHVRLGWNMRSTDLLSAIGLAQLDRLATFNQRRRQIARILDARLQGADGVQIPLSPPGRRHVYHQYTVRCADRAGLISRLQAAGVGHGIYYPRPLYEYPHLAGFARDCPESERAAREVLSLPVHPGLTDGEAVKVADAVAG